MTSLILATDMARHGEILEVFKANCKNDGFKLSNEEHLIAVGSASCQQHKHQKEVFSIIQL